MPRRAPWLSSGYPKGVSIPSGSPWCEYRGGLGDATDLHNVLHGADHGAADSRLRPLRVGAGRMKFDVAAPARCAWRRRVWMSGVREDHAIGGFRSYDAIRRESSRRGGWRTGGPVTHLHLRNPFVGRGAAYQRPPADAADHIAKVSLELGGKSPNIVFDDADLEAAANGVVAGIFAATGQTCIAGSRLLVHESVRDELVERVAARGATIRLGDPLEMETEMGPIAFAEQLDKVRGYVELGVEEGARIVTGGREPEEPELRDGYFYQPTVLTDVDNDMRVAREEIFGP